MKRCLSCDTLYPVSDMACPACRWQPALENGLPTYAPALSAESPGFKASHFAELAAVEAGNFWFEARNRLIIWALRRYARDFGSFLEVGCGTGYVLTALAAAFPQARVAGSEIFRQGFRSQQTVCPALVSCKWTHVTFRSLASSARSECSMCSNTSWRTKRC